MDLFPDNIGELSLLIFEISKEFQLLRVTIIYFCILKGNWNKKLDVSERFSLQIKVCA